ncbi:DUF3500 domain-containing protein [Oleiharenicola lentus]|uniref:DUF3500 domain-containing protein n=1 Tax=Oleiharenicola lentus TaxID=2508720 RepID=A0A4Q1C8P8_9BACT|nr:DUF3500 domain-containing protein [Oleiharenicola lentus]RXK55230.1 DUF3500 domain-containing protein [Oleiharenicola lentus]
MPHAAPRRRLFTFIWAAFAAALVAAETEQEQVTRMFAERQQQALAQPFHGVTTPEGKSAGLFPVKKTGVSTDQLLGAAQAFLAALSPEQKKRTAFAVDDSEWRKWCNVDNGIYVRQGTSLKEMDAVQRAAARELMRATLSAKGLALADAIRRTDQTLRELNEGDPAYDEELYFFTVMGTPSATEPWGWQLDGHHLVINTFVLGDQVTMTPAFWGGEPVHTTSGKYSGNVILQEEQDQGLAFMRSLDAAQQSAARLAPRKERDDMKAAAFQDNLVLPFAGLPAKQLSPAQKRQLLALTALFVNNQSDGHARVKLDEVAAQLDGTWFAWIGDTSPDAVFYFRIHSPVILIEFDHQRPVGVPGVPRTVTREHIHVIVRTPNGNDYGKDLLRQHLEQHPHPL